MNVWPFFARASACKWSQNHWVLGVPQLVYLSMCITWIHFVLLYPFTPLSLEENSECMTNGKDNPFQKSAKTQCSNENLQPNGRGRNTGPTRSIALLANTSRHEKETLHETKTARMLQMLLVLQRSCHQWVLIGYRVCMCAMKISDATKVPKDSKRMTYGTLKVNHRTLKVSLPNMKVLPSNV